MRSRTLICAAAGAAAFAAVALAGGASALTLGRLALLGGALAAAAAYDLAERRIPNWIVVPAASACAALAFASGAQIALLAGLMIVVLLLIVALVFPRALGMGDVKLALLIVAGLDGHAPSALALGFALAALAGVVLLTRYGARAWRASLPLAPFLATGALVSILPWVGA